MQSNSPEAAKRPTFHDEAPAASVGDSFAAAGRHFGELKAYASYYLSAKVDSYKSSAKSAVLYAVLGLLAGVVGIAVLAAAGAMLVHGISEALAILFGGRVWLADLVTSLVLLGLVLGGGYFAVAKILGKSRTATVAKYEAMNRRQKTEFGANVHERAEQAENR